MSLDLILLFEIEPGGVEFQLEIECFTLEFQMKKPRSHTNLEQEKQQSIIKSNPTKHHQIQPRQEKQTIRGKT